MKIIHTADWHYGLERYGRIDPGTGLHTQTLELNGTVGALSAFVEREKVDLVLFAGDAYKTRHPTPTQQRQFAQALRMITHAGAHVVLVPGNEDLPGNPLAAHTLDVFHLLPTEEATVLDSIGREIICLPCSDIQIMSLPWPDPRWLLQNWREVPVAELHARIVAEITLRLDMINDHLIDPAFPLILLGHIAMMGDAASEASEKAMTFGWHPYFSPAVLQPERFDYVALGHHHRQQQVAENAFYSGSLQRIDFGEEGDPKGFMYLELDPARPLGQRIVDGPRFVEVDARRLVTIDVAPADEDPMPEILRAIEARGDPEVGWEPKDAIVRVLLALSEEQARRVDDPAIRAALKDAHYIAGIQRSVGREERRRAAAAVETMGPLDALRLYWESQGMPDAEREGLLARAGDLLRELEAPAVREEALA